MGIGGERKGTTVQMTGDVFFEWANRNGFAFYNTFTKNREPTFQLYKNAPEMDWKILDYVAGPQQWMHRTWVPRKLPAQRLTDLTSWISLNLLIGNRGEAQASGDGLLKIMTL